MKHSPDWGDKLVRYSLLAGATGCATTTAKAAVFIHTSGASVQASANSKSSLYFDFETGNTSTSQPAEWDFALEVFSSYGQSESAPPATGVAFRANNPFSSSVNVGQNTKIGGNVTINAAKMAAGDSVPDASLGFLDGGVLWEKTQNGTWGEWDPNDHGYLGFKFEDSSGNTLYGWADITLEWNSPPKVTLNRFAYESIGGTPIVVPEPESLLPMALLALGAAGLTRYRRQRKEGSAPRD